MSCAGIHGSEQAQRVSEKVRDALMNELFRRWETAQPGSHKCFTGSDAELVAAVELYRDEQDPERG